MPNRGSISPTCSPMVEAGVHHREHEPAVGLQQQPERPHEWFNRRNIHEGHAADCGVETRFPQTADRGFIGRVRNEIVDIVEPLGGGPPARKLDHPRR